jgi:hypothetical protein
MMVIGRLRDLLRGNAEAMADQVIRGNRAASLDYVAIICVGCGLYGCTVGLWRAPLQSVYTAIKFPLLIFLTSAGNALLNGMLAQLLGSGLSFRQTFLAILMSFAVFSVILGGLSPITLFVVLNAPPLASGRDIIGHSVVLLTHVVVIAYAGILANRHLLRLLERTAGGLTSARKVLFSWLAGNLFLGAQIAWVLRPFIGSPRLAVQFLREDPLRGNFYEAVWRALLHIFA